jgi:hypothetical protein
MERYAMFQFKDGKATLSGNYSQMTSIRDLPLVHVWDAESAKLVGAVRDLLNPHLEWAGGLAWRMDSRTIAAGHLLGLLDLEASKRTVLVGFSSASVPLFSPDGRFLLASTGPEASLFDLTTLQPPNGWIGGALELRRIDAAGKVSVKTVERGDSHGCSTAKLLGHDGPITAAAFSPDNRWVVTASEDRTARIWEVPSGRLHQVLRGHLRRINGVTVSSDGLLVVTASDDHTARIWEAVTGKEVFTFANHNGCVRTAVFSRDGSLVLTASDDGTARLWPADPLAIAQKRRPRELTAEERSRFTVSSVGTNP